MSDERKNRRMTKVLRSRTAFSVYAIVAAALLISMVPRRSSAASPRNWVRAASSSDGSKYLIDTSSWRYGEENPSQVVYWEKITGRNDKIGGRIVRSSIGLNTTDCSDNTYLGGPLTLYDSRGRVVKSWDFWNEDWQTIVPDSVGEGIRDFVCEEWDAEQASVESFS